MGLFLSCQKESEKPNQFNWVVRYGTTVPLSCVSGSSKCVRMCIGHGVHDWATITALPNEVIQKYGYSQIYLPFWLRSTLNQAESGWFLASGSYWAQCNCYTLDIIYWYQVFLHVSRAKNIYVLKNINNGGKWWPEWHLLVPCGRLCKKRTHGESASFVGGSQETCSTFHSRTFSRWRNAVLLLRHRRNLCTLHFVLQYK